MCFDCEKATLSTLNSLEKRKKLYLETDNLLDILSVDYERLSKFIFLSKQLNGIKSRNFNHFNY